MSAFSIPSSSKVDNYSYFSELEEKGYIIIPILEEEGLREFNHWFIAAVTTAPELNRTVSPTDQLVLGEIGYLPFASVWYSTKIRELMSLIYWIVFLLVFSKMDPSLNFFMIPDRAMFRAPGQAKKNLSKKKWHQDAAPNALPEDLILGGWINLNLRLNQVFKCIPGSQKRSHPIFDQVRRDTAGEGFAAFSDEDMKRLELSGLAEVIDVPPGNILIFIEKMIHTVMTNGEEEGTLIRIHTSFMVSHCKIALHDRAAAGSEITQQLAGSKRRVDDEMMNRRQKVLPKKPLKEYFQDQQLVPVRSGQDTPVYSPMHMMHKPKIATLSEIYSNTCREENRDDGRRFVKRILPSMREMEELSGGVVKMHCPMTEKEMGIYFPRRIGELLSSNASELNK